MCTVVVVPAADAQLIVAVNRDERLARSLALPPSQHQGERLDWLAPVDPDGGGTWVAINQVGCAVTVLNDYRSSYQPTEQIRSRGRLVVDLVQSGDLEQVQERLEGCAIELARYRPFIALVAQRSEAEPARAIEAHWDGRDLAVKVVELPRMWVSSGVPGDWAHRARQAEFERFIRNWTGDTDALHSGLDELFSSHQPDKGPLSICMHTPPTAHTVSHTRIQVDSNQAAMEYRAGAPCQAGAVVSCRLALLAAPIDSPPWS